MSYCIAIVGRANVGKSSLFNAIYGHRVAIVDSTPGVTRDRVAREIHVSGGGSVELVDTGGVGMESAEELVQDVETQIEIAISKADLTLFVVDAISGVHPDDHAIADRLRQAGKEVLLVANKADRAAESQSAVDFFELGLGEPVSVSVAHNKGMKELKSCIRKRIPAQVQGANGDDERVSMAIVGQRNVGKSTLINYMAGERRVVVNELPGTTRDSVDVMLDFREGEHDLAFTLIDTAGVRKKKQLKESIDYYSQVRTHQSIVRADVAVHMIDAQRPITKVDKKWGGILREHHKPTLLAINKMDLAPEDVEDGFIEYIWENMPGMRFAPVIFISAKTGENVFQVLRLAHTLYQQAGMRVQTSELNELIQEIVARRPPPSGTNRRGKIFFATQVDIRPPTIALFTNDSADINDSYRRYILNELREVLPYPDVPVKLIVRRRRSQKSR